MSGTPGGGKLKLNKSLDFGFDDDTKYTITPIEIKKESCENGFSYKVRLKINDAKTPFMQKYDVSPVTGNIQISIEDINSGGIQFKLYKNCNLPSYVAHKCYALKGYECKRHLGGTLQMNESANYGFDDGSDYTIKANAIQKETYQEQFVYRTNLTTGGIQYSPYPSLKNDIGQFAPEAEDVQIMIADIDDSQTKFKIYKDCDFDNDVNGIGDTYAGFNSLVCNNFSGPGAYQVHPCDRIKQSTDSNVYAYIESVNGNGIILTYRVITEKGEFNAGYSRLSGKDEFNGHGNGYFGINLWIDKYDYSDQTHMATLEVKESCQPVYDKCMNMVNSMPACESLCPYEKAGGYDFINIENKYFAKVPAGHETFAECCALSLKKQVESVDNYFGFKYPFPKVATLYLEENPYLPNDTFYATGWGFIGTINNDDTFETYSNYVECVRSMSNYLENIKVSGHEVNHNILIATAIRKLYGLHSEFEEGLVNYIPAQFNDFFGTMTCLDYGYKNPPQSELISYKTGDIISGQCFWKQLKDEYGHDALIKIIQKLDESRYIDKTTGKTKTIFLFKDIINPIIGSDVLEKKAFRWYGYEEDKL